MPPSSAVLSLSQVVLRALTIGNLLAGVAFVLLLAGSLLEEARVLRLLRESSSVEDTGMILVALRSVLLLGLCSVPLAHMLLVRLRAIVDSVRGGTPFLPDNARRLKAIAWLLLGLQLLDLAYAVIAWVFDEVGSGAFDWTFSLTGWLAVLLLFVLARVFDEGTRMQDDLQGTV